MKKLALLAALSMVSASAFADATIQANNYDPDSPLYYLKTGTVDTGTAYVEILFNDVSVMKTTATDGYFDNGIANSTAVADGATANVTVRAWKGDAATTWATAQIRGSATWSEALGSWNSAAVPAVPATGPTLNIPAGSITMTNVPEPSTIALGVLGAAALLLRRRS